MHRVADLEKSGQRLLLGEFSFIPQHQNPNKLHPRLRERHAIFGFNFFDNLIDLSRIFICALRCDIFELGAIPGEQPRRLYGNPGFILGRIVNPDMQGIARMKSAFILFLQINQREIIGWCAALVFGLFRPPEQLPAE